MNQNEAHREIDATLRSLGFIEIGPGPADYEGQIRVHGQPIDVRIEIPDSRFVKRPRIHLKDRLQINLDLLAHVEAETGICYASAAGLPLDNIKPGEAILRVLKEAERTLERSYKGGAAQEIADEFQHYWKPKFSARSLLSKESDVRAETVGLYSAKQAEHQFHVLNINAELRGYQTQKIRDAWIVHSPDMVGGALMKEPPSDMVSLEKWWEKQPSLAPIKWSAVSAALCRQKVCFVWASNAFIGFELCIPNDIATGLRAGTIRAKALPTVLSGRMASLAIDRWAAGDCSIERITQRNNPMAKNLAGKKVALVGCGTIGSHLARMLVQSGAGSFQPFYVFDDDFLSAGNIGRHLLNFDQIGQNKATALAVELQRFHPNTLVTARSENAAKNWALLETCDLVIDATGEWNVQCALNDMFLERREGTAVSALLHCWVFMNGAGAQSFLNLGDDRACFRCLKPDFAGPWRFPAAKDDDELNLVAANCGDGTYVPFSVDASIIAASLANRAALDWANGKPGKRLRTVAVDLDRGRYHKPVSPEPAKNCPACQALRPAL